MQEKEWNVIEALRHARHDWMNDIQLVKGFLALNKIDEAARAADHIIVKAVQESKLCNLGMPGMAEMFITFNWEKHNFLLEFEIDDEMKIRQVAEEAPVRFFQALFSLFDQHVSEYSGQNAYVGLTEKEGRLSARIEWEGEILDQLSLIKQISQILQCDEVSGSVMKIDGQDILVEANF